MKNKGFTLVELSIVLVIIGLLIGGILVAQSMISTVQLQRFVGQIQSFDVAVTNFHNMYKAYPGDATAMGGDGNGVLGPDNNSYDLEKRNFFPNLQVSGLKAEPAGAVYSNTITTVFTKEGNTPNSPKMQYVENTGVMAYSVGAGLHYYMLSSFTMTSSYDFIAKLLTPMTGPEAKTIDNKIDDAIYNSGAVRALGPMVVNDTVANGCIVLGVYNTSTSNACNLRIDMAPHLR